MVAYYRHVVAGRGRHTGFSFCTTSPALCEALARERPELNDGIVEVFLHGFSAFKTREEALAWLAKD
jgi:hypothetical protein